MTTHIDRLVAEIRRLRAENEALREDCQTP